MWTPVQFSKRIQHSHVEDSATGQWSVVLYPASGEVRCLGGRDIAEATAIAQTYIDEHHPGYVL
jgi:hypothetical protein